MNNDLAKTLIENVLNWPFLALIVLMFLLIRFRREFSGRISAIHELTLGGSTKITLGIHQVDAKNLGDALTQALRDLEARVEKIEGQLSAGLSISTGISTEKESDWQDIPEGLKDNLWHVVEKMLNSEFWYARYVSTLAKNTSTSEELMLKFLRSRPDVELFKSDNRWCASLRSRSANANK